MDLWPFRKPKSPGFGISKSFYLSVLSNRATLPSILELINPTGADGAPEGFGAPLAKDASKDALQRPIERGAYALVSKDRKTVVKMLAFCKEEVGFDPEPIVRVAETTGLSREASQRIRATWSILQLSFESYEPWVYPSLDWVLAIADRLALLTDGVIADPLAERYVLPGELLTPHRTCPEIDARDHVSVKGRPDGERAAIYSRGMQKFALPEFEILDVPDCCSTEAQALVYGLCQKSLMGTFPDSGDRVGSRKAPFEVREGGHDKRFWDGVPCWELLPPTGVRPEHALNLWIAESSGKMQESTHMRGFEQFANRRTSGEDSS